MLITQESEKWQFLREHYSEELKTNKSDLNIDVVGRLPLAVDEHVAHFPVAEPAHVLDRLHLTVAAGHLLEFLKNIF